MFRPFLLLLLCSIAQAAELAGVVVSIADGDTLTVLVHQKMQYKVRLAGIDAPERGQPFSNAARQHLSWMAFRQRIDVEYEKTDQYGRIVGKVWVNGYDASLEQLRAGFAWHYKQYEREQSPIDRRKYSQAESEARASKIGLWIEPGAVPPWEWRRK